MKKSTLILACLIGLAMLASCKKDEEPEKDPTKPTISAVSANYDEVYSGDEVTVGFTTTGENLTKVEMSASLNGEVIYSHSASIDKVSNYNYSHTFTVEGAGIVTISGTVTDEAGQTATASFDFTSLEKPNAKFVGHYEGDALFTGTANITFPAQQQLDLENESLATILDIVAGDNMNEVKATVVIGEQTSTANGVVDNEKVVFEAISSTYTIYNFPIDMTYNIKGMLNGSELILEGECTGDGMGGTISVQGTIGGSLTKIE